MPNTPVPAAAPGLPSITRRAALAGLAALPAVTIPDRLEAAAPAKAAGGIEELIAEWRWRDVEWRRLILELSDLEEAADLPEDFIRFGRRVILNLDGSITRTRWLAMSVADVERYFRSPSWPHDGARLARRKNRVLARLRRQKAKHAAACDAAGIPQLAQLCDYAFTARQQAHVAIVKYRPVSVEEMRAKDAWLLARTVSEDGIYQWPEHELVWLFGGEPE